MNGIAWCNDRKLDNERTCKSAIKTLEDWNIRVINAPTRILNINDEETL